MRTGSGIAVLGGVVGLTLVSKTLGFLSQLLVTALYGTTRLADTFHFSNSIQNVVAGAVGGSAPAILVPKFLEVRHRVGRSAARQFASAILTWFLLLLLLLAAIMAWQADHIIASLGAFSHDSRLLAVSVFRTSAPLVVLMGVLQLLSALSHAEKRFLAPATMGILHSFFFIGVIVACFRVLGVYALVAGAVLGVLAQVAVLSLYLRRLGELRPTLRLSRYDALEFLRLWWPLLVSQGLGVIQVTANRTIASILPVGSVAALSYAEALKGIFLELFVVPVAAMSLPFFAEKILAGDIRTAWYHLQIRILGVWFFIVPVIVLIWFFSEPLIATLYQRRSFTAHSTAMTASALSIYAVGLFTESAHYLISRFYLALKDTHTLTWLSVPTTVLFLVSSYYTTPVLLHDGVALSFVLMVAATMISGFGILRRRLRLPFAKEFLMGLTKVLSSAAFMCLTMWALLSIYHAGTQASLVLRLVWIALVACAGLGTYGLAALAMRTVQHIPIIQEVNPWRIGEVFLGNWVGSGRQHPPSRRIDIE